MKMNKMELRERLDELRKVINKANTMVFSGDMIQAGGFTTIALDVIRGILEDLSNE